MEINIKCPHCDEDSFVGVGEFDNATTFKSLIGKVIVITENNLDQQVAEEIGRVWSAVKPLELIEILKAIQTK